jgi:hypothetical protein
LYSVANAAAAKSPRPKTRTSFASRTFEPTAARYQAQRIEWVWPRISKACAATGASISRRTASQTTSISRPSHQT